MAPRHSWGISFSCKSFFLCPSCGQKRTLLLGEYLAQDLLPRLPHRQFVWTIPKASRGFLKRDQSLFAGIGKLIFAMIGEYYSEAAGRLLVTGMVSSHRAFGEFAAFEDFIAYLRISIIEQYKWLSCL